MFLAEFEEYNSEYEKGIKKISYRSSHLKIVKEPIDLKLEKTHGNYDLFFNSKGVLIHSIHPERNKNYKIIYGYNKKGVLIAAMSLLTEKNELISISEFEYDDKGRIETETVRTFNYSSIDYAVTEQRLHAYTENKEKVIMISDAEGEEDEHTIYLTYNNKQNVIENKAIRNDEELVYWNKYEYNEHNQLIKEISLDENGEPDGVYEYISVKDGFKSGYYYKSKHNSYLKEFSFTYNEKGHWINQIVINDGEPRFFYDRTIEYY